MTIRTQHRANLVAFPAGNDVGELFLAELRSRRERFKELMRMVNQEAGRSAARHAALRTRLDRISRLSGGSVRHASGRQLRAM
jgi:hypothetical protein